MATSRMLWYSRSVSVMRRRDGDRVAGVHAHRVEVLDRADDHDVVGGVAHHLQLVLLPAEHALLDSTSVHRAERRRPALATRRSSLSSSAAAAGAAHRERRADDDRVAELLGGGEGTRPCEWHDRGAGHVARRCSSDLLEQLAVFAALDRVDVGADQLDAVLLEHARPRAARSRC